MAHRLARGVRQVDEPGGEPRAARAAYAVSRTSPSCTRMHRRSARAPPGFRGARARAISRATGAARKARPRRRAPPAYPARPPSLSRPARRSARLIATFSSEIAGRPPACPSPSTARGRNRRIAAAIARTARGVLTGSLTALTTSPPISRPSSCAATSHDGLLRSPPNGSKPLSSNTPRTRPA